MTTYNRERLVSSRNFYPFEEIESIRLRLNLHRTKFCELLGYNYSSFRRWQEQNRVYRAPLTAAKLLEQVHKPKANKLRSRPIRIHKWSFNTMRLGDSITIDMTMRKLADKAARRIAKPRNWKFQATSNKESKITTLQRVA